MINLKNSTHFELCLRRSEYEIHLARQSCRKRPELSGVLRSKCVNSNGRKRISACARFGYRTAKTEEAVKGAERSSRSLTASFGFAIS